MITIQSVRRYVGPCLLREPDCVYLPCHPRLTPYIANYTVTCPMQGTMPEDYTILPTASATLSYSIVDGWAEGGLRGVNTRAAVVGGHANRFDTLLLIEFHPGGLYPLIGIPQSELMDDSFPFAQLDTPLHRQILEVLLSTDDIAALIQGIDRVFLQRLMAVDPRSPLLGAIGQILDARGGISAAQVAAGAFIGQRQLERLFRRHIGAGVKSFSRIVRVNHALKLLRDPAQNMTSVAMAAGYFDQSHFIRDFEALCSAAPGEYLKRMSVFYNDAFKM